MSRLNAVDKSVKAANLSFAVSSGVDAASTVISTIAGINDQKKRLAFEQNFSLLNFDQQGKLNELLVNAQSESERLAILAKTIEGSNTQRISNIANLYAEQEKKKRNEKLIIGGGILLVGLVAIIIIIKKT
jgi:hypothetical protein